jgi:hypothetical protein
VTFTPEPADSELRIAWALARFAACACACADDALVALWVAVFVELIGEVAMDAFRFFNESARACHSLARARDYRHSGH